MLIAELRAEMSHGVLLVTDAESSEPIPEWTDGDARVTSSTKAFVMQVVHGQEGECLVRVWADAATSTGQLVHTGTIDLPSGVVRLLDSWGESSVDVPTQPGWHMVEVFADAATEAAVVDIVIRPI